MIKVNTTKREEFFRKLRIAKEEKRKFLEELVAEIKVDYKQRTGKEALAVEVW